jgi:hypothetical protein
MTKMNPALRKEGDDEIYTPEWAAIDMIQHFKPEGKILEPCKGSGIFTNLLPTSDWCEINEGRDFFDYTKKVDWIISNPPYSLIRKFVLHSFQVADNIVYLIPVWKAYNAIGLQYELRNYGGIKEIRWYGGGGKLGFPMGNGIGAVYWKRNYTGPTYTTFYEEP